MLEGIDTTVIRAAILIVVGFIGGMVVPAYYGFERLSGFGRWVADKLPYVPPPGKSEDEALEEAVAHEEEE